MTILKPSNVRASRCLWRLSPITSASARRRGWAAERKSDMPEFTLQNVLCCFSCRDLNYLPYMPALIISQVVARSPLDLGIEPNNSKIPPKPLYNRCLLQLAADNVLILLILREIWNDWDGLPRVNIHGTNTSSLEWEHMWIINKIVICSIVVIDNLAPREKLLFLLQGNKKKFETVHCNVCYHFCETWFWKLNPFFSFSSKVVKHSLLDTVFKTVHSKLFEKVTQGTIIWFIHSSVMVLTLFFSFSSSLHLRKSMLSVVWFSIETRGFFSV